jgi:hypothetical protein
MKDEIDNVSGLTPTQAQEMKKSDSSAVNFGDVSSSYAFQQMTTNLVVGKQKDNEELDKKYTMTPKAPVVVGDRTVEKGGRLKVLRKEGKKVIVRDDRGNEAAVAEESLELR